MISPNSPGLRSFNHEARPTVTFIRDIRDRQIAMFSSTVSSILFLFSTKKYPFIILIILEIVLQIIIVSKSLLHSVCYIYLNRKLATQGMNARKAVESSEARL